MSKAERAMVEENQGIGLSRPYPPKQLLVTLPEVEFLPAPEITDWIRDVLLSQDSPLFNEDHVHLDDAQIGCLWTSKYYTKHQREVMGLCEVPNIQGNTWLKGRMEQQLTEWFGGVPDFVLTFYAPFANAITNAEWCRLIEHEVYHCGQQLDDYGMPKFTKEGVPKFGIRGHDVEEFVGVVRRYGISACHESTREFVEAANQDPEIAKIDIASMCGTCLAKV